MDRDQQVVEQRVVPALLDKRMQRAGRKRCKIDGLQLRHHAARHEGTQAGSFGCAHGLGQQAKHEAREIGAALAVAHPFRDERCEIDFAQLGFHRPGIEEMLLDEFAELVGDAMLVVLDDGGVRNRQSQRPAEQRHNRVPVRKSADGCGFCKCRHETPYRVKMLQGACGHKHRETSDQHQRRQQLDAPEFCRANRIARTGIERRCAVEQHKYSPGRLVGVSYPSRRASQAIGNAASQVDHIAAQPALGPYVAPIRVLLATTYR